MMWSWLMVLWCTPVALADSDLRTFLDAIRQVETGHLDASQQARAVGDQGRSLGPYQITWKYWKDSGVPGRYESVRNRAYAERVMIAYWRKYCPNALSRNNWQILARIHNGGPDGHQQGRTAAYWRKVREVMR